VQLPPFDGEIAFEHATIGADRFDHRLDVRPPQIRRAGGRCTDPPRLRPESQALYPEATDLHGDVRQPADLLHPSAPSGGTAPPDDRRRRRCPGVSRSGRGQSESPGTRGRGRSRLGAAAPASHASKVRPSGASSANPSRNPVARRIPAGTSPQSADNRPVGVPRGHHADPAEPPVSGRDLCLEHVPHRVTEREICVSDDSRGHRVGP